MFTERRTMSINTPLGMAANFPILSDLISISINHIVIISNCRFCLLNTNVSLRSYNCLFPHHDSVRGRWNGRWNGLAAHVQVRRVDL